MLCVMAGPSPATAEDGIASVYGTPRDGHAGKCVAEQKPTGGCKRMDPRELAAAHRTLPFGTIVRVTHRKSGRWVLVRINDRGPFVRGRVIDLTPAGAARLGFEDSLAPVTLTVVAR